jgi:hypothetical protein
MRLVGADISTKAVDLVALDLDTDHAQWKHIPIHSKRGSFHAARNVRPALGHQALLGGYWDDVAALWVEDPMSRNMGTCKALALVTGALIACVPQRVIVERTKPNEWQHVFTGKTKATKADIEQQARALLGHETGERKGCVSALAFDLNAGTMRYTLWPQDAYDAYGIAWAARELMTRAADAA